MKYSFEVERTPAGSNVGKQAATAYMLEFCNIHLRIFLTRTYRQKVVRSKFEQQIAKVVSSVSHS